MLTLGYVQTNHPWLSSCGEDVRKWSTCTHPGICVEIWQSLMVLLGYQNVRLRQASSYGYKNERGRWNGLMGMLQRGEIDATLADVVVDEERFSDFIFAAPVNQLRFGFAIGQAIVDEGDRILPVQVFAQWVLVMLCALTIIVSFVDAFRAGGDWKAGFWSGFSSSMMQKRSNPGIHAPFVVLGYTLLFAVYYR